MRKKALNRFYTAEGNRCDSCKYLDKKEFFVEQSTIPVKTLYCCSKDGENIGNPWIMSCDKYKTKEIL